MAGSSDTKLVATRVSRETWEVLQVAAVAEGVETQQALLLPVIEAYAEEMLKQPEVRAMLDEASKYRARRASVTDMAPARKRRQRD